ncbi:MAG: bifunctional DNA-formamidopyrimidine glycosylase/DNA-(apurinic or apyrimidinic site) lyase [Alphaproteobacteria bacterium]|nr:bifunctional DNA-formamidopyrimidine glycosylase/DNA-(apurinic or apyrimidinic site) lyase [Alphaproteobacteria bacterium]
MVRGLRPLWVGRRMARVVQRRPDLRTPFPKGFAARLEGRRVAAVERRAKYILCRFEDGGDVLVVHLGMSGRLVHAGNGPPPGPHDHVDFALDDGGLFRFTDPRRFGLIDLLAPADFATDARFAELGPEPLADEFDAAALAAALAGRRTPIKAALLDQSTVAGLGNIYVCEALFQAGISPRRVAATVQGDRAARLVIAIKDVLARAIAAGGSSARDYVQASGELGWFQHQWAVYDREGEACPGCDCAAAAGAARRAATGRAAAGRGISRIVQSGRSTFYCKHRQR